MAQIPTEAQVRPGPEAAPEALTGIHDHDVRETALTFDTTAFTARERLPRLRSHPPARRCASPSGCPERLAPAIACHATSGPYRPKAAHSTPAEVSVYRTAGVTGPGGGTLLRTGPFGAPAGEDVHRAYAAIVQPNEASARLHDAFGFRHVGTYREVGRASGRYRDVARYAKPMLSRTGPNAWPGPSRSPR